MDRLFRRADILLPADCDMTKWSVVACDQFSSQPEYWQELDKLVGDAPSTLRLMLPEAFLKTADSKEATKRINACMDDYLRRGIFKNVPDSYIYVERTQPDGRVRCGLVGVLDLEYYDYSKTSTSPIRATEGTVEERLPPRVEVRRGAALEMPHIMVFIDDADKTVIEPLHEHTHSLEKLYDFDLNADGGHIRGWRVTGAVAETVEIDLDALANTETLTEKYGVAAPAIYAMGDGNHSLATAKKCWEEIKETLSEKERETHPARFGLVELVNIHDEAISFQPIHRVIFDTDAAEFVSEAEKFLSQRGKAADTYHEISLVTAAQEQTVRIPGLTIGQLIAAAEDFCQSYISAHGGKVDYIHNDDTAIGMGRRENCAALLLPPMEKSELFPSIIRSGPFPKKSFSIGHAQDKRYYLECRKIK